MYIYRPTLRMQYGRRATVHQYTSTPITDPLWVLYLPVSVIYITNDNEYTGTLRLQQLVTDTMS